MKRYVVVAVTALLLGGCSSKDDGSTDDLQIVAHPVAAKAAPSPAPARKPAGKVIKVGGAVSAIGYSPDGKTLGVAVDANGKHTVQLRPSKSLASKGKTLPAASQVERIDATQDGWYASEPNADEVLQLNGSHKTEHVAGQPTGVAQLGAQRLVALRAKKAVAVGKRTIGGDVQSVDQVLVAGKQPVVVDRLRSAVFEVDMTKRTIELGLRAGQGVTNAVVDRYHRVLAVDARTGALMAFSVDPLLMRQRYPVGGKPYGIAYDAKRNLAWVTLTDRNEVVGFDVSGGEPVEKHRYPTVRQPNSVTVDQRTGSVVVASASGAGIQVIKPR